MNKENIYNVPNFLTLLRVIMALIVIYLILNDYKLIQIVIAFLIGMTTDFLDGQIARKFNTVTEFGRKFDIIADRILMIGTAVASVFYFSLNGVLNYSDVFQVFIIMSREIVSLPYAAANVFSRKFAIPHAKFIGKITTFMQTITLPLILLNAVYYKDASFSIYFALITFALGVMSGITFIKDMKRI